MASDGASETPPAAVAPPAATPAEPVASAAPATPPQPAAAAAAAPEPAAAPETAAVPAVPPPQPAAQQPGAAAANAGPFGTADEEVARLLRSENINYYAVFKLQPDNMGDLRKNYFRLSRLVHPDKCAHQDAAAAQAVVTQAYDTLNNPVKKKLYDSYASNVDTEKPEGMSYAEWESRQVEIPRWLERILRIPGGGICLFVVLIPVLVILFVILLVINILCLPVRCFCRICCGVRPEEHGPDADANV